MSNYLLIDSTYRDRVQNPNPSDFIIPFQKVNSQVINENVFTTVNPITNPYPGYNFQFPNFDISASTFFGQIIGGTSASPIVDQSLNTMLGINMNDYIYTNVYRGINSVKNLIFFYNGNMEDQYIITAYDPVNRIITLDGSIIDFEIPSTYGIYNGSTNRSINVQGDFISTNSSFLYAYQNLYIYDLAIDELSQASYDNENEVLNLKTPFGSDWRVSDPYLLTGQDLVTNHGTIRQFPNLSYYVYSINEFTIIDPGKGYKYFDILYAVPQNQDPTVNATKFRIIKILPEGDLLEIEIFEIGTLNYNKGMICDLYTETLSFARAKILITSIGLGFRVKFKRTVGSDMHGQFFYPILMSDQFILHDEKIKMNPLFSLPTKITNMKNINNFSNPTDTMSSFYANGVVGIYKTIFRTDDDTFIIVQLFPSDKISMFDKIPANIPFGLRGCLNFMILPFSKEGVVGMNFTSTILTQSQVSCYEISLVNLIIPNLPLMIGPGPLTSALPYLFCEISNVSQGSNKSVLYSNNPYSSSVTFVCSISDVNNPIISKFLKISSDGTFQTIKFSPVDSLHFRIKLPDGSDFITSLTDYLVPVAPNPIVQINALFSIRRLS